MKTIMRWIWEHFLWQTAPAGRTQSWAVGAWKLLLAVPVSLFLTWHEWTEHHPPEIGLVELIHLVFALILIAIAVQISHWLGRRASTTSPK